MKILRTAAAVAALYLLISSCTGRSGVAQKEEPKAIVFGKVVIMPPPENEDANLDTRFTEKESKADKACVYFDEMARVVSRHDAAYWENWGNTAEAGLGTYFYSLQPCRRLFIAGAGYYIGRGGFTEFMFLPAFYSVDIKAGDTAVYIGTLYYERDEFYRIKKINVKDEYREAYYYFIAAHGKNLRPRKSLAKAPGSGK